MLTEFAGSGLSARKFAALVGVRYSTFAHWVQRFRQAGGEVRGRVASIGPVTSAALREHGLEPHLEAARHDLEGLVTAIVEDAG